MPSFSKNFETVSNKGFPGNDLLGVFGHFSLTGWLRMVGSSAPTSWTKLNNFFVSGYLLKQHVHDELLIDTLR